MAFIDRDNFICVAEDVFTYDPLPCMRCLSPHDINALRAWALCVIVNQGEANCDPNDAYEAAKCFSCIEDRWLNLGYAVGLWWLAHMLNYTTVDDAAEAMDAIKCWRCLSDHQLNAIFNYNWCTWLNALYDTLNPQ